VAKLSVANKVYDHILLEMLSVLCGPLEHLAHVFQAVGIHVEDWSVDKLGKVRGVVATSSFVWDGGESNLVVADDVDGATN
jgi:hypothetical protein